MLKKIGSFLLIAVMLMAVLTPLTIVAAQSGQCGDNLFWTLDDEGTLTISGTGAMWNWSFFSPLAPWESTYVKNVAITSGVTSIGASPKGCKELDMTEQLSTYHNITKRGDRNLEIPDRNLEM